jgi:hypothetical protein
MAARIAAGSVPADKIAETGRLIFNQRLDAAVTAALALMVLVLVVEALFEWIRIWTNAKAALLHEAPYARTQWAEGD